MVGHSKWSKVKHIKGPLDVKRGAAFSKLVKEITVAARLGGGDYISGNLRLRSLVDVALAANLSKEKVERVIKKNTGELEGARYEETPSGILTAVFSLNSFVRGPHGPPSAPLAPPPPVHQSFS